MFVREQGKVVLFDMIHYDITVIDNQLFIAPQKKRYQIDIPFLLGEFDNEKRAKEIWQEIFHMLRRWKWKKVEGRPIYRVPEK